MPESVRLSAHTAKSSISRCSASVAWPTMAGSDSMAKPMWRASSCRMRRQTWRSTSSLGLRQHAEQRYGEGLGNQLQADRLEVPRRGAEQRVEDLPDVAADRVDLAVEAQLEIALQHLVVARLVGHLGRLEQLGVLALHVLYELAAQQHGAMLALHQGGEAPTADAAVELDTILLREPVPEARAVDVDEIVRDQPAIARER